MNSLRALLALGLVTIASLFVASPASAIYDHSGAPDEWEVGCSSSAGSSINDIAVDEDDELVYVYCDVGNFEQPDRIYRYDYDGNPVAFEAAKSYLAGNEITGNPAAANGTLNGGFAGRHIAVDNSGGPHDGEIYVIAGGIGLSGGTENVAIFKQSGEFAGIIEQPEFGGGSTQDVEIGPDGSVYVTAGNGGDRISKYNAGYVEVARMYPPFQAGPFVTGNLLAIDNTNALWHVENGPTKYEADQLFTNFSPAFGANKANFTGTPSPFVPNPLIAGFGESHIAVDPTRNDLYVHRGNKIEVFSEGNAADPAYKNAPSFGEGIVGQQGIAVTEDHLVFASHEAEFNPNEAKVVVFGPGNILPDIHTDPADVEKVTHDGGEITGSVDLDGGTQVESCKLEIATSAAGPFNKGSANCTPGNFATNSPISASIAGLTTGTTYFYRFSATNQKGTNFGGIRSFTPAFVLKVKTLPATGIDENGATLNGQLDPDGKPTDYFFEYGVDTNYGEETDEAAAGSGSGVVPVSESIENLPAGRVFHYRIVAIDENGKITRGEDLTFRTASPPEVSGLRATDLTETSAVIHATINPQGFPTKYHFEYGTSPSFGQSIPVPEESIGSGTEAIEVKQTITNLTPGVTYFFKVVATNEPWGTAESTTTTFDYAPPSCPNSHARQQTASTFLPDCRAYELVSPGAAGAVSLYPGKELWDLFDGSQQPLNEDGAWPQNYGLSSNPPRLMFYGILGTIEGLRAPNLLTPDAYLATRTASGWVTTLPGLDDSHGIPSGKQCAEDFSFCLEFNQPIETEKFESEAWVHDSQGKFIGKLPTNANTLVGANEYKGFRRVSGDFSNFAFSSNATKGIFGEPYPGYAFTVDGLTEGAGSAYDNDLEARTVKLISRLPNTNHIPQNGTSDRPIQFPGLSDDGSHILMLTEGGQGAGLIGPPYHLYMRVNDLISYDISKGTAVEFVGMTRDGSQVTFTSEEALTSEDEDTSVDLYRWSESGDSLKLLSVGNGKGNTDDCGASWAEGCGVEVPNTERRYALYQDFHPGESNPLEDQPFFGAPGMDDVTSEENGDVYFYSPELLDGSKFGIPDQKNLYVARSNGQVQLVASLEPNTEVQRSTIATDGKFAALLTESRLTSYDNKGKRQVYVYDRDQETLVCASCRPGLPPTKDVAVSQGGKFMADDGRAFFATEDSLVPKDKNGEIFDVYEYVGGRPQLISSGLASRDFTGETTILGLFAKPEFTGLEAVSRDGLDVYFSTFSSLVDEDHNGQFLKFYDARVGGGFSVAEVDAPCAAADECHGADSSPPTPPTVASETPLGATGNVVEEGGKNCASLRRKAKKNSKLASQLRREAATASSAEEKRKLNARAENAAAKAADLNKKAKACSGSSRRAGK